VTGIVGAFPEVMAFSAGHHAPGGPRASAFELPDEALHRLVVGRMTWGRQGSAAI
jgi:hypothetical protein